jgi:hypothetical protein
MSNGNEYIDRHRNSKARQEQRREDAQRRNAVTAELSVAERIKRLDQLFGPGLGATHERARLLSPKKRKTFTEEVAQALGAEGVNPDATEIGVIVSLPKKQKRRSRDQKRGN